MKLLAFLSNRLSFLKRRPLLPHLLDAFLAVWTALTQPTVRRRIVALIRELEAWPSITEGVHRFGGIQFDRHGRELGHVHGNGVVDVRLPRSIRNEVVSLGKALPHHTFPDSGWVTLPLLTDRDLEAAIELFRRSSRSVPAP